MEFVKPPQKLSDTLRTMADDQGTKEAARCLGITGATLLRAAAGLQMRPGTILLIERNLSLLPKGRRSAA